MRGYRNRNVSILVLIGFILYVGGIDRGIRFFNIRYILEWLVMKMVREVVV